MNAIFRILLIIIAIITWRKIYRFYKDIGRRCPKCGEWRRSKNHRKYKIIMAPDEMISIKSPAGKLRWWIRRIEKRTFSHCLNCSHVVLVKIDLSPMSIVHAKWIRITDKEQYYSDPNLDHIYDEQVRHLRGSRIHDPEHSYKDTPPLTIPLGLFPDMDTDDGAKRMKNHPKR